MSGRQQMIDFAHIQIVLMYSHTLVLENYHDIIKSLHKNILYGRQNTHRIQFCPFMIVAHRQIEYSLQNISIYCSLLNGSRIFTQIELKILSFIKFFMRKEILIASIVSIAVLAAFYHGSQSKSDSYSEWKVTFGVNFHPEEDAYRRLIFEKNVEMINRHNADASQTYKMGVNQFTVYTTEEFAIRFLNAIPAEEIVAQEEQEVEVIGDVDWVTKGMVSPVKNQGSCGSCWAFSATGVMESWARINSKGSVNLSEQQLVDCSHAQGNQGCNGGWPSYALNYVKANGIASESEYRYAGKDQTCQKTGGSFKIAGQQSYTGCTALTNGINSHPISIAVDATNWSPYKSGVFNNCKTTLNHAVLLVGVVGGNWKVKNSWGASWGESGYIRLANGNTCGLCNHAGVVPT